MTEEEFRNGTGAAYREHGLSEAYRDVHQFHRVFDHPRNFTPTMQPHSRKEARADWIDEEVRELREASTLFDAADAYLDIAYFAIGGLVEMGINPGELWRIVHGANMAKVQPDGSVKRREDGKIIKPEGWVPPDNDLKAEIARQLERIEASLFAQRGYSSQAEFDAVEEDIEDLDNPDQRPAVEREIDAADRLATLHESGRAGVRAAMGEKLLREPSKAPEGRRNPHDSRFKPPGFA